MNAIEWVAAGFAAAVLAAAFDGAGTVVQAKAAQSRDMAPGRRGALYAVGVFVDVLGWALTVVALRFLPVFAVQAIVAGQTAVTVVLAHLVLRSAIHSTDLLAIACAGLGLAALAASATTDIGWTASPDVVTAVLLGLPAAVVLAAVWAASRGAVARSVVTGLAFGGSAVSVRALLVLPGITATPAALLTQPLTYAVIGYAAVGVPLYASALRHSTPAMPSAIVTMIEVVVTRRARHGVAWRRDPARMVVDRGRRSASRIDRGHHARRARDSTSSQWLPSTTSDIGSGRRTESGRRGVEVSSTEVKDALLDGTEALVQDFAVARTVRARSA